MNENETLREQMWDLCYGLLSADEVTALHKQIKSDPAAARLYAEVRLQADLVAAASKIEDASVSLSVPDEGRKVQPAAKSHSGAGESPFKPGKSGRTRKKLFTPSYRTANWLAALAATTLLALVGYGLYAPTQFPKSSPPDSIVASVYANQPLQGGLTQNLKVVARDSRGEPASTAISFDVICEGNVLQQEVVHTDKFGEAQLSLAGSAVKPGAVLELQAQSDQQAGTKQEFFQRQHRLSDWAEASPKVVVPLAAKPEPVTSDVQFEKDSYQPGETVRFRVHTWQTFSKQPASPATDWKLVAADGREIEPASIETRPEAGSVSGEFPLPADAPQGYYSLRGVNRRDGPAEEVDQVAVGMDGPKSGDLARRASVASNYRYLQTLERETLAEKSREKGNDKGDKSVEQRDGQLSMAKKGKAELALADAAPLPPAPTVVPPLPAPSPAPAGPAAAKVAAAPGGAPPTALPREEGPSKHNVAGKFFKTESGVEKGELSHNKHGDQHESEDRSGVIKTEGSEMRGDALAVQVPEQFAHMNLWAVVRKGNVTVATEQYKGRALKETNALGSKFSESIAAANAPATDPATEPAAPLAEGMNGKGMNENDVAAQSLTTGTRLNLPLPPEADGELGVTLYDQSTQPPQAVYRQLVRRASPRDLNIVVKESPADSTPQSEMRLKLTATDRNGDAVPHSYFSARIVKADPVSAEEGASPLASRFAIDRLGNGGGSRGRSMAGSAPGAAGGLGGAGFGGGGGRAAPPKDGDVKEGKKDEPQKKEVSEGVTLDKETKLKKAQVGSVKPGELAAKTAVPAPATPALAGAVETFSAESAAPHDFAKQLMQEDQTARDELAMSFSDESLARQPAIPQEVLLGSNDSLIQDAVRAEEVAAEAARASFQRMTGRVVLAVAAAALLMFGLLAILHRPAQAKVWIPAMVVVAGSFIVGCIWLMSGHLPPQQIAGHAAFSPDAPAPMSYTEDFKSMAPAKSFPLPMMDDSRSAMGLQGDHGSVSGIGPTIELPANAPAGRAEEKPASFGAPPRGGGSGIGGGKPAAAPTPEPKAESAPKSEPAARPSEPSSRPSEPAPADNKLRAEDDKKKPDENRESKGPGNAKPAKDAAESKRSGSESARKPVTMKSVLADSRREKRAQAPGLLWQPNLPANEKGEAELSIPLPAEAGDYYLLVDVQGPSGVGTALVPIHVPPAAPASPAKP